ncbi:MAG: aspartate ammonia-lyase [candidate division Zixibacteria bacterium]|nr:aspartate ammonia-lyase [candidate division Zixibacteria bacterium]
MDKRTIADFLKRIELFQDLSDSDRELLTDQLETLRFAPGELLFEENSPRRNLWVIFDGQVELFKRGPLGPEKRLSLFGSYDFLGEGALMDDYPHSASARAVDHATILAISRDRFLDFLERQPGLASHILSRVARVISRRMRQASTMVVDAAAQYVSGRTRIEHDLLGERAVPYEYYYGIQTLRAIENFPITGISLAHFPRLIEALAMVKMAAARANHELGLLPDDIAVAVEQACQELLDGRWHTHFVVDMIQGGAGTSTNMNANEVIANRALEILGRERGEYDYCHPNNHVNLSQSTNDAYPTALNIALINSNSELVDDLRELIDAFRQKATEFAHVLKMGRTQLQDAVPMTLGQNFDAWATTLTEEIDRLNDNARLFLEVNMGGTAIGTGINAEPDYSEKVIEHLRQITRLDVKLAPNLVEATQDTGALVMYSSAVKRLAVKLSKICNDLRLLSSGPRAGINEINLPAMQPGSSIMPGKVNPVIPEVVNQIAFKVIGNDLTVTLAAQAGQLELNVMEPVIAQSLFESIEMLKNGMATLRHRCVLGITANEERCRAMVENSIGLVTALNPVLGYETSTKVAKEALATDRGVYDLVLEKGLLSREQLNRLLDPKRMLAPQRHRAGG